MHKYTKYQELKNWIGNIFLNSSLWKSKEYVTDFNLNILQLHKINIAVVWSILETCPLKLSNSSKYHTFVSTSKLFTFHLYFELVLHLFSIKRCQHWKDFLNHNPSPSQFLPFPNSSLSFLKNIQENVIIGYQHHYFVYTHLACFYIKTYFINISRLI